MLRKRKKGEKAEAREKGTRPKGQSTNERRLYRAEVILNSRLNLNTLCSSGAFNWIFNWAESRYINPSPLLSRLLLLRPYLPGPFFSLLSLSPAFAGDAIIPAPHFYAIIYVAAWFIHYSGNFVPRSRPPGRDNLIFDGKCVFLVGIFVFFFSKCWHKILRTFWGLVENCVEISVHSQIIEISCKVRLFPFYI